MKDGGEPSRVIRPGGNATSGSEPDVSTALRSARHDKRGEPPAALPGRNGHAHRIPNGPFATTRLRVLLRAGVNRSPAEGVQSGASRCEK
jgi:hypothetical protein